MILVRRVILPWTRQYSYCQLRLMKNVHKQFLSTAVAGTTEGCIDVSLDEQSGIAILRMSRKPVNSLSLEFLKELIATIDQIESNKSCNGLIITSAIPKIFCAGLDIGELYQPKRERFVEFMNAFFDLGGRIYLSRLATAAAITGHSPAGGCQVAMCCDYRVMSAGNFRIGLNEAQLGLVVPTWLAETMRSVIGNRHTDRALQRGTLFTPSEALDIGLVDQVTDVSDTVETARNEITKWLNVPNYARYLTKQAVRRPMYDQVMAGREREVEKRIKLLFRDETQEKIGHYLKMLKARKR